MKKYSVMSERKLVCACKQKLFLFTRYHWWVGKPNTHFYLMWQSWNYVDPITFTWPIKKKPKSKPKFKIYSHKISVALEKFLEKVSLLSVCSFIDSILTFAFDFSRSKFFSYTNWYWIKNIHKLTISTETKLYTNRRFPGDICI